MNEMIDDTDIRILQILIQDAKRSHKEIGEEVDLTGQAVGARVRKLQDLGVIEGYTVKWNPERLRLRPTGLCHSFLELRRQTCRLSYIHC